MLIHTTTFKYTYLKHTAKDLPCLQKPLSYHGQSLILDSGSMCKNGHSLLLHSPVKQNYIIKTSYTHRVIDR